MAQEHIAWRPHLEVGEQLANYLARIAVVAHRKQQVQAAAPDADIRILQAVDDALPVPGISQWAVEDLLLVVSSQSSTERRQKRSPYIEREDMPSSCIPAWGMSPCPTRAAGRACITAARRTASQVSIAQQRQNPLPVEVHNTRSTEMPVCDVCDS